MKKNSRSAGQEAAEEEEEDVEMPALLPDASAFVKDRGKRAYGKMLMSAAAIVSELDSYLNSCVCHRAKDVKASGQSWYKRCRAFTHETTSFQSEPTLTRDGDLQTKHCPLKGCLAPYLAAGAHKEIVEEFKAMAMSQVVLLTEGLDPEDRSKILLDFEKAVEYICYIIEAKLVEFDNNPLKFCGLAHHDPAVARRCAQEGLAKAQTALSEGLGETMRPLTQLLGTPGSPLWTEIVAFIKGTILVELQFLPAIVARLRFIPLLERFIEGLHRYLKKGALHAPHFSGAYMDLMVRLPCIRQRLREDPSFLFDLAAQCDQIRSMHQVLDCLQLSTKKAIMNVMQQNPTKEFKTVFCGHSQHKVTDQVVYRLDVETQYGSLQDSQNAFNDDARLRAAFRAQGPQPKRMMKEKDSGEPSVIAWKAICQHMRSTANTCKYYSAPRRLTKATALSERMVEPTNFACITDGSADAGPMVPEDGEETLPCLSNIISVDLKCFGCRVWRPLVTLIWVGSGLGISCGVVWQIPIHIRTVQHCPL